MSQRTSVTDRQFGFLRQFPEDKKLTPQQVELRRRRTTAGILMIMGTLLLNYFAVRMIGSFHLDDSLLLTFGVLLVAFATVKLHEGTHAHQ